MAETGAATRRRLGGGRLTAGWIVVYVLMTGLVAFTALPLLYIVVTAFKPIDELFIYPPRFWVQRPTFDNFRSLVWSLSSSEIPFLRYLFNSVFTTIVIVFLTVVISSMGAYGLEKHRVPFGKVVFNIVVAALMFSPHVTRIPSYLVVNKLGMIDTYWALIIPALAYPYYLFLMKQFITQFPNELLESARMDGAREGWVFLRVVMPNIKPAWSTLIVLSFVLYWNDVNAPLVYTQRQVMKVLPLAINTVAGTGGNARLGATMAATLIMIVPTIAIYTLMQAQVIKTMVHSGIKA
jgi:ABC-type glycerol-3-phosphate transport system permease component